MCDVDTVVCVEDSLVNTVRIYCYVAWISS